MIHANHFDEDDDIQENKPEVPAPTKRKPGDSDVTGNTGEGVDDDDEGRPAPPKKARTASSDDIHASESDVTGDDEYTPPTESQANKKHRGAEKVRISLSSPSTFPTITLMQEHSRRPTRARAAHKSADPKQ